MKTEKSNSERVSVGSSVLLAVDLDGSRTRCEIAMWANLIVTATSSLIPLQIVCIVVAACFWVFERKYRRLYAELSSANDPAISRHE